MEKVVVKLGIQKCEFCGEQFRWIEIQKNISWGFKPILCKKCGLKHNVTFQSRRTFGIFTGIIALFILLFLSGFPLGIRLTISLFLMLIHVILFPYYAKYKANKNDYG
jgi:CXXC-20-CXXC protein